jgi:hypothetical protein
LLDVNGLAMRLGGEPPREVWCGNGQFNHSGGFTDE